ncbi:MAG: patatin family protein, partial [Desulfitobacterium hafniense]|nr:patatin family protein [Desulfitobacterium hafniense]
ILTRNESYRKKPFKQEWLAKRFYPKYIGLIEAMVNRHQVYNDTLDLLDKLEADGTVFVIRPLKPIQVDRLERNPANLEKLYEQGINDSEQLIRNLTKWLSLK